MNKIYLIPFAALFIIALALLAGKPQAQEKPMDTATSYELATLAGGCFWCVESDLEKVPGVLEVISGYSGGQVETPSYEEVSSGTTGHLESVQVKFDPAVVSYAQVLDAFWRHIDPTDARGSFVDRGQQYTSAIFVHSAEQRRIAEASKKALAESGVFSSPIVTPIRDFESFYPAEDYHQDYYKTHPLKYRFYRYNSGRDSFSDEHWEGHDAPLMLEKPMAGASPWDNFTLPDDAELKQRLSPLQYDVTQHEATEAPFDNTYWDNKKPGIYVDIVSGEPLFSSTHKYKSGTGWPSFWQPLVPENIVTRQDNKLFTTRTEVRSKHADSHLGHVFNDGPQPTGLRYCMNSAALRFIPADQLQAQGYGQFSKMFE